MRINRREFLKATAAAGILAAANGPILNSLAFADEKAQAETGSWIASTCQGCTQWCPCEFFVQD